MKRTEVATIILIASASMVLTFFAARAVIGKRIQHEATVEQTQVITDDVKDFSPSKRIFNKDAINPTVEVYIENSSSNTSSTKNSTTPSTDDESTSSTSATTSASATSDDATTDTSTNVTTGK